MEIGIIGIGIVGGATRKVISKIHKVYSYDKYKSPYNSKSNLEKLVKNSEAIFLCVPTPVKPSGEIDYSSIDDSLIMLEEKTNKIRRNPEKMLIIVRSIAVSGTTDKLAEKYPFNFVFNPEFLREKTAIKDMQNINRIIIGANRLEDYKKVIQIYKPIFPKAKYIYVNRKTAEMIKYSSNTVLAGQIAIANELYNICNAVGVDYNLVKETILLDERIGRNIDVPGPDGDLGFGGKCFPKDLNALIYLSRENMYRPYLLEEIWRLNENVRKNKDWFKIPGAISKNNNLKK